MWEYVYKKHVSNPQSLMNEHPRAKLTQKHVWGNFDPDYSDDWPTEPTDPLLYDVAV